MSLQETPQANRLHIAIYGPTNSGKSSLINALTGQDVAMVSSVAGTTGDPVYKAMELHGIGPVVFIDTAGFDDNSSLGELRIDKTKKTLEKSDVAILVMAPGDDGIITDANISEGAAWATELKEKKTPYFVLVNKSELMKGANQESAAAQIQRELGMKPILVSAKTGMGIESIREKIKEVMPEDYENGEITAGLAKRGDSVMLVMPQDAQAPKGRLILPQVQTLRELLDKGCIVTCTTAEDLEKSFGALSGKPDLIITDSQVFQKVYDTMPVGSKLTSFSVLFAGYKGDAQFFAKSAAQIDKLTPSSKVLIAEACTHAPIGEDIGKEKIPAMLKKRIGSLPLITFVSGADFPDNLTEYDLIIHCGACMFNRKHVMSRITMAKAQGVAMTNYGMAIAHMTGILDKVAY